MGWGPVSGREGNKEKERKRKSRKESHPSGLCSVDENRFNICIDAMFSTT